MLCHSVRHSFTSIEFTIDCSTHACDRSTSPPGGNGKYSRSSDTNYRQIDKWFLRRKFRDPPPLRATTQPPASTQNSATPNSTLLAPQHSMISPAIRMRIPVGHHCHHHRRRSNRRKLYSLDLARSRLENSCTRICFLPAATGQSIAPDRSARRSRPRARTLIEQWRI